MATTPNPLPPPPDSGMGGGQAPPPQATAPGVATAPATGSPQLDQGTQLMVQIVSGLRALAMAFPATSSKIAEINNLMQELPPLLMQSQPAGEPMAPPNGG